MRRMDCRLRPSLCGLYAVGGAVEPSSVMNLSGPEPVVIRAGKGDVSDLVA